MHNNFIKHFIVGLIIFSNFSFGKEFDELFTIYEPIENSSKIEKSINSSFNNMVYRLSGSDSPSNIWKIINSGVTRKDFIISYSIKNIDDLSYLQVIFNQDFLISKFNELSIPIVGYSRPVIFFLIEIDSGSVSPYFLSADQSKNKIDNTFKSVLKSISKNRGIFLEIPVFDLQDRQTLSNMNILSSPSEYISSKYEFDELVKIKLTNLGLDNWQITGDIKSSLNRENLKNDLENIFLEYVQSITDKKLNDLKINTNRTVDTLVSISGISSYKDYIDSRDRLSKFIGISSIEILSLKNNIITYKIKTLGDMNTLINEIQNNSFLHITDSDSSKINIEYKK